MHQVSIVMASYNGAAYIRQQIESILKNTYKDWTLEVCDDGSTDETISIVKEYAKQYPGQITLHQNKKNLGVVRNFLEGVKRAKGEYIMFADQDDVWLPEKIAHTLQKMKETEGSDTDLPVAVFTDAKVVKENLQEIAPSFHRLSALDPERTDLPHLLMENKLIGCTVMCNRKTAEFLTELPQNARYHDWWIGLIASAMGKISYLPEATLLYRQHGTNEVGAKNYVSYIRQRISTLKKQKQSLLENQQQAKEFLSIYAGHPNLSPQAQIWISDFSVLSEQPYLKRRIMILKKGYLKTGKIRNLGLLFLI